MAMDKKTEQNTQNKRKKADKRGFYAALAICFLAIGIAAWSTYDTMSGFITPTDEGAVSSTVSAPQQTVEPSVITEDPESAVSEGHGHGTASAVVTDAEPEKEPAESTAAPTENEAPAEETAAENTVPAEETAAEPVSYTPSESFLRPVGDGEILTAYSDIPVYSETMRDYRVHLGADYTAERGETVKAIANGIVKDAYTDMLLGNILVIEHGDTEVRYCGLGETFLVDPGEVVRAGQDIGSVTAAPFESAMETHLHIEATENGTPIDPETLFN